MTHSRGPSPGLRFSLAMVAIWSVAACFNATRGATGWVLVDLTLVGMYLTRILWLARA